MDKDHFFSLLDKQAKGLSSPEENRLISDVFDAMQQRSLSWDMNEREEAAIKTRIKRRVDARLGDTKKERVIDISFLRYAAAIFIVLGLAFVLFNQTTQMPPVPMAERITGPRQKAVITLRDGSLVYLNVNSKIRFPEEFASDSREIELEGEAFFEVVPDGKRPFVVASRGVKTRVLGTSFNVKAANKNEVEVMVKTGSVGVFQGRSDEERQLVLSPNQLAVVDPENRSVVVSAVNVDDYLTWRSETITFDLVPFGDVMSRLERVYNVKIEIEGMDSRECLIRASYENRSLFTILYGLKNLADFDYEQKADGNLVIRYRGCKN
ncbi:MAG: FecR domain-containing protein [Lunatimonas sp.]|uniref:FecR family protein n=1 Tax=Lunatimonas sp. TaxID=2060141 RepID=UPI00263AB1DC|nr:FecR family protein [Lunatimonas sp.]MCC5939472.1 FecR domain-containing protein [Lunatimonas sp.]